MAIYTNFVRSALTDLNTQSPVPNGSDPYRISGIMIHSNHPSFPYLVLLVFEAVLEVICVSLPGYIAARQGMFDAEAQKLVANLNVALFTPCLVFTKIASQLTAEKLTDLAIIPFIFAIQTCVSYMCSAIISRLFRFKRRQSNFVTAMAVFGNSNSLPISLVISLSQTLPGLHWDQVPNDNDDEVAARGILYLLIFQQLGQLIRWSWGYHVLLAPKGRYEEEDFQPIEPGHARYTDNPDQTDSSGPLIRIDDDLSDELEFRSSETSQTGFESGSQTPVTNRTLSNPKLSALAPSNDGDHEEEDDNADTMTGAPLREQFLPHQNFEGDILTFPNVEVRRRDTPPIRGVKSLVYRYGRSLHHYHNRASRHLNAKFRNVFNSLPPSAQKVLTIMYSWSMRFLRGLWDFMNPPLWAMLVAIIVASVPTLQKLFFDEGTFVRNSVTRAISQNGQVAVPLILVVLGANLARNTLPKDAIEQQDNPKEERNLIIASLVSRMLLPTLVMTPILTLLAKFAPVSILDDPIFIVVCFLLTGAPSALQLAQICQINNIFMGAMSKILFQSYVIWILPSTLFLVVCAIEVVEWVTIR